MLSQLFKINTCQASGLAVVLFVLIGAGCQKHPLPVLPTLTVLDAHGAPPDSGFCLLVRPGHFFTSTTAPSWDVVGDSLQWDRGTGLVKTPFLPPPGAHWLVAAPSHVPPYTWRRSIVEVHRQDTCQLSETFAIRAFLRSALEDSILAPQYHILASSDADLIQHVCSILPSSGTTRCEGWVTTTSFPVEVVLKRELANEESIVDHRLVDFEAIQTDVVCAWGDEKDNG